MESHSWFTATAPIGAFARASAVQALQPTISAAVDKAIAAEIQKALAPVEARIREIGPWELASDQRQILSVGLKNIPGRKVWIQYLGSPDSTHFALSLEDDFKKVGWGTHMRRLNLGTALTDGVMCTYKHGNDIGMRCLPILKDGISNSSSRRRASRIGCD
jgi:hypothetical protein